ncbi:hypothetical protein NST63_17985 [Heyndrickxia sp. FSL W8-0496]|uniref:hypothetical protein n=1 Tax=Heyndrickxia sp. FSL W8-0496 TaxID=2954702 RepID=UPI0030F98A68
MFKTKMFLYKMLHLLKPKYKKQLDEIRRSIWVHKGFYLNEITTIELAISHLHTQEVVKRNSGENNE